MGPLPSLYVILQKEFSNGEDILKNEDSMHITVSALTPGQHSVEVGWLYFKSILNSSFSEFVTSFMSVVVDVKL